MPAGISNGVAKVDEWVIITKYYRLVKELQRPADQSPEIFSLGMAYISRMIPGVS